MGNGTQISTSVTIINSLLGFEALSLSGMDTTSALTILAGSKLEIASAFFTFGTILTPNASSWTAISTASTAYLAFTPSGTAGSQIVSGSYVDTTVWSTSKQGWYTSAASVIRCTHSIYKTSPTVYSNKAFLMNPNKDRIDGSLIINNSLTVVGGIIETGSNGYGVNAEYFTGAISATTTTVVTGIAEADVIGMSIQVSTAGGYLSPSDGTSTHKISGKVAGTNIEIHVGTSLIGGNFYKLLVWYKV